MKLSDPARGLRIRVVVVDNASGDAPAIAEAIESNSWSSWVTLVRSPKNGGFAYGNNLAFRVANDDGPPDYFYLLNPDTLVRKGAIGALVRFLEAHPDVGIVGSGLENLDGSEWPIAFRFPSILSELENGLQFGLASRILQRWVVAVEMSSVPQPIDWVPGASMMCRPAVFDAIGGLDENYFLYFEETDFCLRAKRAGFPTWYVPESRVMHIAGQSTKVTERDVAPKRLPSYWFESRRRYFVASYGTRLCDDGRRCRGAGSCYRSAETHRAAARGSRSSLLSQGSRIPQCSVAEKSQVCRDKTRRLKFVADLIQLQ